MANADQAKGWVTKAWPPVRAALAVLGLWLCAYVLQLYGRLPALAERMTESAGVGRGYGVAGNLKVRLREAAVSSSDRSLSAEIVGNTPPGTRVEAKVAQRRYFDVARDGTISFPIRLVEGVSQLHVVARPPGAGEVDEDWKWFEADFSKQLQLAWQREPPTLEMALGNRTTNSVWVAGRATGWFLTASSSLEDDSVDSDDFFDALLPLSPEGGATLSARTAAGTGSPLTLAVTPAEWLPTASFPLARSALISSEAGRLIATIEIELPDRHPAFRALVAGDLEVWKFVDILWNWQPFSGSSEPDVVISRNGALGVVKARGEFRSHPGDIQIGGAEYSELSGSVPTRRLLWSDRDSVTVRWGELKPRWFGPPLPTSLDATEARWVGPLSLPSGLKVALLAPNAASTPESQSTASSDDPQGAPAAAPSRPTLKEYAATDRYTGDETLPGRTWRALLGIMPLLALAWLARRRPFGDPKWWPPLAATSAMLAAAGLWSFAYDLRHRLAGDWLWRLTGVSTGYLLDEYFDPASNAFYLVVVATAATAPITLSWLERRFVGREQPNAVPNRLRQGALVLRILWAAAWLTALAFVVGRLVESNWTEGEAAGAERAVYDWLGIRAADIYTAAHMVRDANVVRLIVTALALPIALAAGVRALAFWLGWALLMARFAADVPVPELLRGPPRYVLVELREHLEVLDYVRWWVVVVIAMLLAIPLVRQLLGLVLPRHGVPYKGWLLLAAGAFVCASVVLHWVPAKVSLIAAGTLLLAGVAWVGLNGARRLRPVKDFFRLRAVAPATYRRLWLLAIAAMGAFAWPTHPGDEALYFRDLFGVLAAGDELLVVVALGLFVLVLKNQSQHARQRANRSSRLDDALLIPAVVLFTFFVSRTRGTWLFVPVAMLVAFAIAKKWLLRPDSAGEAHPLLAGGSERRQQIERVFAARKARSALDAAERALAKKLSADEVTPTEYRDRLSAQRAHYEPEIRAGVEEGAVLPFSKPALPPWETSLQFVRLGAFLAALPLVVTLYQLPAGPVAHPYPTAEFASLLVGGVVGWLAIAFFFGYFYPWLRGDSGLQKGLCLGFAVIAPTLVLRLLHTPGIEELRTLGIWAMQVLPFCALLGAFADFRALHAYGFRVRDLVTLYELPWLSVYASSLAAAVISGILGLLSGKLGDVLKFFAEGIGVASQ